MSPYYAEMFYNQMVAEKRIDSVLDNKKQTDQRNGKDIQTIDVNSIRNKDVKEIGAEWLAYQAINQMQIGSFLKKQGWSPDDINLAKHGWSKEKRSDAKLIVLALVVNPQGFIKYCAILKGNISDCATL